MSIDLIVDIDATIADRSPVKEQDWQDWFGVWADSLTPDIMAVGEYEVTLLIVDDAEIAKLNAQYRQLDCPTDVLAFAALEADVPVVPQELIDETLSEPYSEPTYLGDIIISVTTAQRQAAEQGHSVRQELAWLAAHGLLHLLGWDHPDRESLESMLAQQDAMLRSLRNAEVFEAVTDLRSS
ncbi:rRNA maturation RNase YbeY [Tumidithrix elongata RA019]|uniref:Endoribonuclease YbeY n=1 Tax=Tumidithrix elongata BACA0141 TaxID=2716417 RepID=A0AAW9Q3H3_9CYAN|nr:rRNA maturation RNase YbeY [Tumidithrix elongata RA019]